ALTGKRSVTRRSVVSGRGTVSRRRAVSGWRTGGPGEVTGVVLVVRTAAGRVDQAARREDRRRRQHPVGIVVDQPGRPWPLVRRLAVGRAEAAGVSPGLAAWSRCAGAGHARTGPAGRELSAGRRTREAVARAGLARRVELARRNELARWSRAWLRHAWVVAGRHRARLGWLLPREERARLVRAARVLAVGTTRPHRAWELTRRRVARGSAAHGPRTGEARARRIARAGGHGGPGAREATGSLARETAVVGAGTVPRSLVGREPGADRAGSRRPQRRLKRVLAHRVLAVRLFRRRAAREPALRWRVLGVARLEVARVRAGRL